MSIFKKKKKKTFFDVGKGDSSEDFLRILKAAAPASQLNVITELYDGAAQAFREGRPGNIQTAFLNEELTQWYDIGPTAQLLLKISEEADDKLAAIALAFEKIPAPDRPGKLNKLLNQAIDKNVGDKSFYALLLDAGAEADAFSGHLLVTAAGSANPVPAIKLLLERGASLDDARESAGRRPHTESHIAAWLTFYEEKIARETAAEKIMGQMREQIAELTERNSGLEKQIGSLTGEVTRLPVQAPASADKQPKNPTQGKLRIRPS